MMRLICIGVICAGGTTVKYLLDGRVIVETLPPAPAAPIPERTGQHG